MNQEDELAQHPQPYLKVFTVDSHTQKLCSEEGWTLVLY